jgi:hypothetical protein
VARSFRFAQTFGLNIPTPHSTHIFAALVFASQSPYSGRQNPLMTRKRLRYSRNVMRNLG